MAMELALMLKGLDSCAIARRLGWECFVTCRGAQMIAMAVVSASRAAVFATRIGTGLNVSSVVVQMIALGLDIAFPANAIVRLDSRVLTVQRSSRRVKC